MEGARTEAAAWSRECASASCISLTQPQPGVIRTLIPSEDNPLIHKSEAITAIMSEDGPCFACPKYGLMITGSSGPTAG